MANVLRFFEAKELAEGLRAHGHEVSDRTVQRWKAGESAPKPQDLAAVWRLLGVSGEFSGSFASVERKIDLLLATAGIDPVDVEDEVEARRLIEKARAQLAQRGQAGVES